MKDYLICLSSPTPPPHGPGSQLITGLQQARSNGQGPNSLALGLALICICLP